MQSSVANWINEYCSPNNHKDMEVNIARIEITPEIAKTMLLRTQAEGFHNRKLRRDRIIAYANEMSGGKWRSDCEPIQLTRDGIVIDGQHRLAAVIKAGLPVKMLVLYGVQKDAFSKIDIGILRKTTDMLHIDGVIIKNADTMFSGIRRYILIKKFGNFDRGPLRSRMSAITYEEIKRTYLNNKETFDESFHFVHKKTNHVRILSLITAPNIISLYHCCPVKQHRLIN